MKCFVINLPGACERRVAIDREFRKVGLPYELWPAVDGHDLTDKDLQSIDRRGRLHAGLAPLDSMAAACLLSHLAVFRQLIESGDDMVAIFEDDARLHPDLPDVLEALDGKAEKFDVVKLNRSYRLLRFFPVYQFMRSHSLGRVKYQDHGAYGYVITRHAAARLLERFPRPVHEIDWIVPRFWENGLRYVLYVDPPVVFHDDILPSHIEHDRVESRLRYRRLMRRNPLVFAQRMRAALRRSVRRFYLFRRLRKTDRDIDPSSF